MNKKTRHGLLDRFWAHVAFTQAGCWLWQAYTRPTGYGSFQIKRGVSCLPHRFAWEQVHGPLEKGVSLRRRCPHRGCVRPDHLIL